jgi:hypothetical protein
MGDGAVSNGKAIKIFLGMAVIALSAVVLAPSFIWEWIINSHEWRIGFIGYDRPDFVTTPLAYSLALICPAIGGAGLVGGIWILVGARTSPRVQPQVKL